MKQLRDIHEQWKLSAMAISLGGFLGVFASSAMAQDPVVGVDPEPIVGEPGVPFDLPLVFLPGSVTGILNFSFDVQFPADVEPVLTGGEVNGTDQCNQNATNLNGSCFWNSNGRILTVAYGSTDFSPLPTLDPLGTVRIQVGSGVVAPTSLTLTTQEVSCFVPQLPVTCTGSNGTILIGAPPALALAPPSATLPNPNDTESFTVSNTGDFALGIDSIELPGAGFSVGGTCGAGVTSLDSGEDCTVTVTFTGGSFANSTLTISTETGGADPASVSAPISGGVQQPLVFEDQFESLP